MNNEKILFVDDEQNVLDAFKRQWHRRFAVSIASSGLEGLQIIQDHGPFAVIVTDMRMPEMDGIDFLKEVQRIAPDSVRLMLTGNADQKTAIDAVNEGHVFRFLNKPCPNDVMLGALEASVKQYSLIMAERELIEGTLKSSISLFMDMLSLHSPVDMTLRGKVLEDAKLVARAMGVKDLWQMEMAAMMSNVADATLPPETRERLRRGDELSAAELDMVHRLPTDTHDLLDNIPRMHKVARIMLYQNQHFDGSGYPKDGVKGVQMPIESRILHIVNDMQITQKNRDMSAPEALQFLQTQVGLYDPELLPLLIEQFDQDNGETRLGGPVDIGVDELAAGQRLESNIETLEGRVLVKSGSVLNEMRVKSVLNYHKINRVREPITVRQPS